MEDKKITAFRVLVSGEATTFDSIDTAISYLRGQYIYGKIDNLIVETVKLTLNEYREEVEKQDNK